jgi:hypothetical protein
VQAKALNGEAAVVSVFSFFFYTTWRGFISPSLLLVGMLLKSTIWYNLLPTGLIGTYACSNICTHSANDARLYQSRLLTLFPPTHQPNRLPAKKQVKANGKGRIAIEILSSKKQLTALPSNLVTTNPLG